MLMATSRALMERNGCEFRSRIDNLNTQQPLLSVHRHHLKEKKLLFLSEDSGFGFRRSLELSYIDQRDG